MPVYPMFTAWPAGALKARLLKSTYVFSRAHRYLSDVSAHNATGTGTGDLTIANATTTVSDSFVTLDCDDLTWNPVTSSDIGFITLYEDTGTASTSRLVALIDVRDNGVKRDVTTGTAQIVFSGLGVARFEV